MKFHGKMNAETFAMGLFFCLLFLFCRSDFYSEAHAIVRKIEVTQEFWLLFCALATCVITKPWQRKKSEKRFWLWSIAWWLLLYGRSISWGQLYFPEMPHLLHRISSIVFIALVAVPFCFSPLLRREIQHQVRQTAFSLWSVVFMLMGFLVADTIEHHRLFASLFISERFPNELAEELYEVLFLVALFSSCKPLLMRDENQLRQAVAVHTGR